MPIVHHASTTPNYIIVSSLRQCDERGINGKEDDTGICLHKDFLLYEVQNVIVMFSTVSTI